MQIQGGDGRVGLQHFTKDLHRFIAKGAFHQFQGGESGGAADTIN